MAMFSVQGVDVVFVEDENNAANKVTLKCQRMVAKITVETSASLVVDGDPGTLAYLSFGINNFNNKIYMLQDLSDEHKDPNWLWNADTAEDFEDAGFFDYNLFILNRALIPNPTNDDYSPGYASENTSQGKLKKEITRATVRATFIPRDITEGTTGNYTINSAHGVIIPQTFYAVTPSITAGTSYFFDENAANAFVVEKGGTKLTYTDGYCYWNIFLNKNPLNTVNKWDVLRNDFYKCNITRIVVPGRNTPDVPDPEVTPDVETNITVEIDILFWHTPIISDYVLE
jgi:hypothetical protein